MGWSAAFGLLLPAARLPIFSLALFPALARPSRRPGWSRLAHLPLAVTAKRCAKGAQSRHFVASFPSRGLLFPMPVLRQKTKWSKGRVVGHSPHGMNMELLTAHL